MTAYVLRRLVHSVFVLFGVSIMVFFVLRTIGDPARLMLPMEASSWKWSGSMTVTNQLPLAAVLPRTPATRICDPLLRP